MLIIQFMEGYFMTFLFNTMVLSFLKFIITTLILVLLQRDQHNALTRLSEKFPENSTIQQMSALCFISIWVTFAVGIYAIYNAVIVFKNAIDLMIMCF